MRTAVFGGSFNPVHLGHLVIAEEVLVRGGFDEILFIPAFLPPHKEIRDPGPEIRLRMLAAAIGGNGAFRLSDCEINRGGVSYSIDTIRELLSGGVIEGKPGLVIGDDLVPGFASWKEPGALADASRILIVRRTAAEEPAFPYPHEYVDTPILQISSSDIRERIASGRAWRYMVPEAVRRIIESERLYGLS